jgi:hypothetical protein
MIPWIGTARDLTPELYPEETAVVSLFEEGPYDNGTRALRSWFVSTSAEMKTLCDSLDELIAEDRERRPEEASAYPLTYSATLVPKADRLDPDGIRDAFHRLVKKSNSI